MRVEAIDMKYRRAGNAAAVAGAGSAARPGLALAGGLKRVSVLNPLEDGRWEEFVLRHPRASLFHSTGWLRALAGTYGYRPVVYTTCGPNEALTHGAVFCEVDSWLTGRRLVALPFSDHCEWLVEEADDTRAIAAELARSLASRRWRYLELRPLRTREMFLALSHFRVRYTFHELDLRPELDTIFQGFHKSSIQRKIRRAERDGLSYAEGRSETLLNHFVRLLRLTRQRHRLPPQPRKWFAGLLEECGPGVKIRVAFQNGDPVAAMMTGHYKDTMMYKYGCSDAEFNRFGSMHLLFWKAIQEAKSLGCRRFDFGRTDAEQAGLITFKSRWGATESVLDYSRYSAARSTSSHLFDISSMKGKGQVAKYILSHLPSGVISRIGELLYRHVG
jgi:CelD/BcsL family acetyltransferase involved in cellulose biosynthesis